MVTASLSACDMWQLDFKVHHDVLLGSDGSHDVLQIVASSFCSASNTDGKVESSCQASLEDASEIGSHLSGRLIALSHESCGKICMPMMRRVTLQFVAEIPYCVPYSDCARSS